MSQPPRRPRTMGVVPPAPPEPPEPHQPVAPRKPRTMGDPAAAAPPPASRPQPRSMRTLMPRAAAAPATPAARAVPIDQPAAPAAPRRMPGQVRAGLKVDAATLSRRFAQHDAQHLAAAAQLIGATPLHDLCWSGAQNLGVAAQQRYGEQVQRLLDVASADVVRQAPQHLARLLQILELCVQDFEPPTGLVGQWLRKDRPRQLDRHTAEIAQLRDTLKLQATALEGPMRDVIDVRQGLQALFDELMAWSMACEWLSSQGEIEEVVQAVLIDRAQALLKNAGLVKQQHIQCLATAQQIDSLRDRIQDAVLIALPSWLAQTAGLSKAITDTQRFLVRDELLQIIQRLNH